MIRMVDSKTCEGRDPHSTIFNIMYGHLRGEHVLDIGGGSGLTQKLIARVDKWASYRNVDLEHTGEDWRTFGCDQKIDIIVANDIFPNVDQRLERFLEKFLPRCREMRLSITFFDFPKSYRAMADRGEVLTMKAWGPFDVICAFLGHLGSMEDEIKMEDICYSGELPDSVFPNRRQVMLVTLKGGLCES